MPKQKHFFQNLLYNLKSYSRWQSVLVIIIVGSLGIAASQALFRDVENSQRGTFVVGTLDLTVEDNNGGQNPQSITIDKVGSKKTLSGEKIYNIHNVGTLNGELNFKLTNLKNLENGCNEPEALVDTSCDNPGNNEGELGSQLIIEIIVGSGSSARSLVVSDLSDENVSQFETQWNQANPPIMVKAGKTLPITIKWHNKDGSLGNEVQSDSVQFDLIYELQQIITQ